MAVTLTINALTTLATVKSDLGISASTWDDSLKRMINSCTDYIEQYCGRSFYRNTAQVDTLQGMGGVFLRLSRTPVNSITSITYNGDTVSSGDYDIRDAGAGLVEKAGGWVWTAHWADDISRSPLVGTERYLYVATYDGGWYTPNQEDLDGSDTRALPWDLENACVDLVRATWLGKSQNPNVTSERLLDWNASYGVGVNDTSVMRMVWSVLDKYRWIDY